MQNNLTKEGREAVDSASTLEEIFNLCGRSGPEDYRAYGYKKWNKLSREECAKVTSFDEAEKVCACSSPDVRPKVLRKMLDLSENSKQVSIVAFRSMNNDYEMLHDDIHKKWIEFTKREIEEIEKSNTMEATEEEEESYVIKVFDILNNASPLFFEREIEFIEKFLLKFEKNEEVLIEFLAYFIPKKLKFSNLASSFIIEKRWLFLSLKRIVYMEKVSKGYALMKVVHPKTKKYLKSKMSLLLDSDSDVERFATLILNE